MARVSVQYAISDLERRVRDLETGVAEIGVLIRRLTNIVEKLAVQK